jgi:hypothetical protein
MGRHGDCATWLNAPKPESSEFSRATRGRASSGGLLASKIEGKLTIENAFSESIRISGCGILAVGRDELRQRYKKTRLRHAVAVDTVEASFPPCLLEVGQG